MEWHPHKGPQEYALQTTAYETLYGGARGGGKTDAGLIWLAKPYLLTNPRARSLVIRKNSDDLSDWLDRALHFYKGFGAKIVGKPAVIKFPSGYKIRSGHLKDDQAYTKYQGQEYQRILIEELTQISNENNYIKLLGSCRSTIDGLDARMFCTTNPGGVGHGWVKDRFIDAAPWSKKFVGTDTKRTRIFIPAKVEDNPTLLEKDPDYVNYLESMKDKDPDTYKAWRHGDWDVFAGMFFRRWKRETHVKKRWTPRPDMIKIGGMDWGRTAPFSFHASAVLPQQWQNPETGDTVKFFRVVTYFEAYGTDKDPRDWSEYITRNIDISAKNNFRWVKADNQIFNPPNDTKSKSIADLFIEHDPRWQEILQASNKDRVSGWVNMQSWMSIAPDGLPYWVITENCVNLIKEIPNAVYDENNVEDVIAEFDHALDDQRYMLKGLKFIDVKAQMVGGLNNQPAVRIQKRPIDVVDLDEFGTASAKFYKAPS